MALKKRFYDGICFDLSLHKGRAIDIQGGGGLGIFLKKIFCFPAGAKKLKCL